MTIEDLLEGEEVIWHGRPAAPPWGYWGVLIVFTALFAATLAWPLTWFLISGEVTVNVILNGRPLTPDTPREEVVAALWGMGWLLASGIAMMTFFTAHRLSQRYLVTSRRLVARSGFPVRRIVELAPERVLSLETRARGRLRTTHFRYARPKSFIWRFYGLGQMSFHDYPDPQGQVQARLSALIHPPRPGEAPAD